LLDIFEGYIIDKNNIKKRCQLNKMAMPTVYCISFGHKDCVLIPSYKNTRELSICADAPFQSIELSSSGVPLYKEKVPALYSHVIFIDELKVDDIWRWKGVVLWNKLRELYLHLDTCVGTNITIKYFQN
jgi:hypothetical protein